MKKSRVGLWIAGGFVFLAAIYSALLFFLKTSFDLTAWILYGFTLFSFLLLAFSYYPRMGRMAGLHVPQIAFSLIYFMVQFIVGGIVMMTMEQLPFIPIVVAEIIWTALYLSVAFVFGVVRSHSAAQEINDNQTVMDDRRLLLKLQTLSGSIPEGQLRQHLVDAEDALRFAFPARSSELNDIQGRIGITVSMLEEALNDHDEDTANDYAVKLLHLIKNREQTAKLIAK